MPGTGDPVGFARAILAGLLTVASAGCPDPFLNILVDSSGNPIRIDQITTITSSTTKPLRKSARLYAI